MITELLFIIDEWKRDKRKYVKESTCSAYSLIIKNHIINYFTHIDDLNEENIQNFVLNKLEVGLKEKTVKDILIVIKMIIRYSIKKGYIDNKEIDIKYPKSRYKTEIDILTISDQKRLCNYIQNNINYKNLGILICLTTGLRIGEICALQWSDIDLNRGVIKINKTIQRIYVDDESNYKKTKIIISSPKTISSIRDVPLFNDLINILKTLKYDTKEDYFFLSNKLTPIEPRSYRNYFSDILNKININKIKFHSLRHTFGTRCIESGADYKTVSSILGHANISTTLNLYVHPNLDQKKKCIDEMFKYIN